MSVSKFYSKVFLFLTLLILILPEAYADRRKNSNDGVVKIMAGSRGGTYTQLTSEMMSVLPKHLPKERLRVVPAIGKGSWQNIQDLLYLKGIDAALVQNDVLEAYARDEEPSVQNRITYIAKLHNEEIHILARKTIGVIGDLKGKKVSFGSEGSGTAMTSNTVFRILNINVNPVYMNLDDSMRALRNGDIDAFVYVSGKPVDTISKGIKVGDPVHFLDVGNPDLDRVYAHTEISSEDYPNIIKKGDVIQSIAVEAVLAVYDFNKKHERYENITRFVKALLKGINELKSVNDLGEPVYHEKWQTIDPCASVIGWRRHAVANTTCGRQTSTVGSQGVGNVTSSRKAMRSALTMLYIKGGLTESQARALVAKMTDDEVKNDLQKILP